MGSMQLPSLGRACPCQAAQFSHLSSMTNSFTTAVCKGFALPSPVPPVVPPGQRRARRLPLPYSPNTAQAPAVDGEKWQR